MHVFFCFFKRSKTDIYFQGDIFSGRHYFFDNKETVFSCWGNLLALTAATPPRSPVASVRTFGWPCVLLNSKLICSAGVQTFFSQGGAPRQRSEIPHRMIPGRYPSPPKWGAAAWGTPIFSTSVQFSSIYHVTSFFFGIL